MEISRQTLNFKKSMQFLSLHVKVFSAAHTSDDVIAASFRAFGDLRNVKMTQTGAALASFHFAVAVPIRQHNGVYEKSKLIPYVVLRRTAIFTATAAPPLKGTRPFVRASLNPTRGSLQQAPY